MTKTKMVQSKCLNITGILAMLVGFFFLNTACTNTSTGAEEEEVEIIEDQILRLTGAAPGYNEGDLRYTRFATTDLNAQRMRVRTTVNVSAAGETQQAVARGYAQFTARTTQASLFADINWRGTMLSAINLSAKTQMIVRLRVREITPTGGNGPVLFTETLESDGIGSGLKALETLTVNDSVSESYQMNLKKGQQYRVEVELECNLRVDI
ncbi:MAG: hypothetical protein JJU37_12470, partial [Balneolaceae bacterium]|nr:hypothetical protein [Balneolaceae bacterium]